MAPVSKGVLLKYINIIIIIIIIKIVRGEGGSHVVWCQRA